jgi:predicted enzyme related to lactoylglutathione lyase
MAAAFADSRSKLVSKMPKSSAVVFAKDVAKVARFYQDVLTMSVVHADADHVVLDSPSMQIVIHAIPADIAKDIEISEPPVVREGMPIKLCLPVPSLATARARAPELGGRLDPEHEEWQSVAFRACDGHDPEGNVVQFRELA